MGGNICNDNAGTGIITAAPAVFAGSHDNRAVGNTVAQYNLAVGWTTSNDN